MKIIILAAVATFGLAAIGVAHAQDAPEKNIYNGDYLLIGGGALYNPSYEGSDDYVIDPVPVIQGRFHGIGIDARPSGLALDFINDSGRKVSFALGPSARLRANRAIHIKDPVVAQLGTLKRAIEIGGTAGVSFNKLLDPYDSLSFSADIRWDINGAHRGMTIDPTVTYLTPVSKGIAVMVEADAELADDKFMDYYYSVTPAGSAASGLPTFKAEGGWRKVGASALIGFDLDGNIANGGFAVGLFGRYERLLGDSAASPIVSIRGSRDQWLGGVGLGYAF